IFDAPRNSSRATRGGARFYAWLSARALARRRRVRPTPRLAIPARKRAGCHSNPASTLCAKGARTRASRRARGVRDGARFNRSPVGGNAQAARPNDRACAERGHGRSERARIVRVAARLVLYGREPWWNFSARPRARKFYTTRLPHAPLAEQQRILFDFVFLHRDNPVMRQMFDWHPEGVITPDALRAQDVPVLLALIERYEGAESRAWAEKWLARQPEKTTVYRDENGAVIGLFVMVEMQNASAAELDADPATRRAWNFLQSTAPLRAGEVGTLYRFWMARDSYQGVSAVQTQIFLTTVRYQLLTPGLAYHFFPCADADFWAPVLMYGDLTRLPQVDFQVDGKTYGVFGHDWRVRPPLAWLDLLAQREVASNVEAVEPPPASPLIVLSEDEFASAVQDALRDFARPHRLRTNP